VTQNLWVDYHPFPLQQEEWGEGWMEMQGGKKPQAFCFLSERNI
jgi:hypothetical protein